MENRIHNITEKTTLGELLEILALGEKPAETPTPKQLRETAGKPVATEDRCKVYGNGWAIYENETGRTVVWLSECVSFTYQFRQPKKNEAWEVSVEETLPDGLLKSQPWPIAVTLLGDYGVERNLMKRKHSTLRTANDDEEPEDYEKPEDHSDDTLLLQILHQEDYPGENPETAYIRRETIEEILAALTEKQRKVSVLYYIYGYSQLEIAAKLRCVVSVVNEHLKAAVKKAKKFF